MRVKVCGMTQLEQVRKLDEEGVDFAGFIFYSKSPRYVGRHFKAEQLKRAKLRLGKVGVFVNSPYDELLRQVDEFGLDMVQLHGDETPRFCEQVANYVNVIKVFRLGEDDPIDWLVRPTPATCFYLILKVRVMVELEKNSIGTCLKMRQLIRYFS
jgi:phosphoribosylanthranilate isomerase